MTQTGYWDYPGEIRNDAQNGGEPVKGILLITRYAPKRVEAGEMLSHTDVQEILRIPLLGVIPESEMYCMPRIRVIR